MLDLGTVIDPKSIKTELSLLKKEAKEAKESPTQKSPSPTPSKTTSNKADKAEKAKIYNFNDDPSKENSPEPEMQGNAEEEGNENKSRTLQNCFLIFLKVNFPFFKFFLKFR